MAHLLGGDLVSNHLSWQRVAGAGSHKPYLFNAENVERHAPALWHSPGTLVDQSYEAMDRLTRGVEGAGRGPGEFGARSPHASVLTPESIAELPLLPNPPANLSLTTPAAAVIEPLWGRHVWLVRRWAPRSLPLELTEGTVVIGVFLREHHQAWPWPEARWRWIPAAIAGVTVSRWWVD